MENRYITVDGNEAVARIAHKTNEVIAIYPITPASPMGEWSDMYSAQRRTNIWGSVPEVFEMQSEAGAAGTVHGSLQTGALTTTFTASQGLLLMMPNMYKIAGELSPTVFHVAARSVAAQALSIFGDHTDVMSVRQTGFAMLASASVQEAHDFALISQVATLKSRIPFLHFFDGFRTSHEVKKIAEISDETIKKMLDEKLIEAHRQRALSPDHPVIRGTSQNPDVYFQGRESVNSFYDAVPAIIDEAFSTFESLTGRGYKPFEYTGAADAQKVIIVMGSGAQTVQESVEYLQQKGEKVGMVTVRLYRPFSLAHFMAVLPQSVTKIGVLDRTKEPGSIGEPLYLDVVAALEEGLATGTAPFKKMPLIIGGRYGLSSKEFTPAMVKALFDTLSAEKPKNHFTLGIHDDVTHTSLEWDESFVIEDKESFHGIFYGLGSDGTVGANKNSIKIIGEHTDNDAQGYFVYDSKKSGSMTVSHLRFGTKAIRSPYLITRANFIACHQTVFLEKFDILSAAEEGATFLLNTPFSKEEAFQRLPRRIQEEIISKKLRFFVINAYEIATEIGLGRRINTIMQTAFFLISGVIDKKLAIEQIKASISKSYAGSGEKVVQMNHNAVDATLEAFHEVDVPQEPVGDREMIPPIHGIATDFIQSVTAKLIAGEGDMLPVSAIPEDGTWPSGTTRYEKRNIALEIPVWEADLCIQCNSCVTVCPHAVIRSKVYDEAALSDAPEHFKHIKAKGKLFEENEAFTIQVSAEDCTGCVLCVEACPATSKEDPNFKAINMHRLEPLLEDEKANWDFFTGLDTISRERLDHTKPKEAQFLEPLFEFSGACPGCGETPYIKLATQLFGDRMVVANATGCSSIYGGNLPTTPWTKDKAGRGPAWSNSLFEDNAEFGLGMRLSIDSHHHRALELLEQSAANLDPQLVQDLKSRDQHDEKAITSQREQVEALKTALAQYDDPISHELVSLSDYLVKKSVWLVGGDGWAYDIGYGGVDHVLASGKNVNILVLDTQVYSNTGGQQSKATPTGAVAKFAAGGKPGFAKDLGLMAMDYGNVYVARIAMGKSESQTLKAFIEAERFDGPSLIIAYSHCIAHGYDMRYGMQQQAKAVESGLWPLFRFDPTLIDEGKHPMHLDYKEPKLPVEEYMKVEKRFSALHQSDPEHEKLFLQRAQEHAKDMWQEYKNRSERVYIKGDSGE